MIMDIITATCRVRKRWVRLGQRQVPVPWYQDRLRRHHEPGVEPMLIW